MRTAHNTFLCYIQTNSVNPACSTFLHYTDGNTTSPTWSTRPMTGCRARSTSMEVDRDLFLRDGNLHDLGMSHLMIACPKPSFTAPCMVDDAVVSRGNAEWTTSKSGHPCPCQNCSQRPPTEKTGREFLLNHPSCSPDNPVSQGAEVN